MFLQTFITVFLLLQPRANDKHELSFKEYPPNMKQKAAATRLNIDLTEQRTGEPLPLESPPWPYHIASLTTSVAGRRSLWSSKRLDFTGSQSMANAYEFHQKHTPCSSRRRLLGWLINLRLGYWFRPSLYSLFSARVPGCWIGRNAFGNPSLGTYL